MQNTLPRLVLVILLTLSPTFALAKTKKASPAPTSPGAQSTPTTPTSGAQNSSPKTPASPSSAPNSSKKAPAASDGGDSEDNSDQGGKTENSKPAPSDSADEDQDPEQAEQESDSVVPKTQQNPFSKPDIDQLVKKQFDEDMWRIMRGGLPCLETSAVCLQQLQDKAVGQSPLLKEIDQRVQEANQKVDDAKARNKKTINLSVFSPALQYMLGSPSSGSSSSGKASPGFFNRLGKLLTGNLGIINDLLSVIGTPFFENSQGGNSSTQSQAIQISDLQVRIAELQRQRAQEADNVRSKVVAALTNFDEARVEFQMSQIVTNRTIEQFQVYEIGYLRGNSDTETYLSKQNSLDHAKVQVYTSWAKMRRTLFQLKLLVLNVKEAENN